MQPFHHRMPVIVPQDQWDVWMDVRTPGTKLDPSLLGPAPNEALVPLRVSNYVNNVRNQGPECIQPLGAD